MSESFEVPGSDRGANVRAKAGQVAQSAAKGSESWIVNAASAPVSVGQAALFAVTSTWKTRGAWAFGVLVVMCGIGPAFTIVGDFIVGAVTSGSDRPLPQDTTISARLGRGTFRTGGAVLNVVTNSISEGVATASQADDRQYSRTPSRLNRTRPATYRRPAAYRRDR